MADVACDTDFLIRLATGPVLNIDSIGQEIGAVTFVVPDVVVAELERLRQDPKKRGMAEAALSYASRLGSIRLGGGYADEAIVEHARQKGGLIATMDRDLKARVKKAGGSIVSMSGNKIVLEP